MGTDHRPPVVTRCWDTFLLGRSSRVVDGQELGKAREEKSPKPRKQLEEQMDGQCELSVVLGTRGTF